MSIVLRLLPLTVVVRAPQRWREHATFLVALLGPCTSSADEFESIVVVETVEDILDAQNVGLIDADDATSLQRVLEQPLHLDTASVAELATLPNVSRSDAEALYIWLRTDQSTDADAPPDSVLSAAQWNSLSSFITRTTHRSLSRDSRTLYSVAATAGISARRDATEAPLARRFPANAVRWRLSSGKWSTRGSMLIGRDRVSRAVGSNDGTDTLFVRAPNLRWVVPSLSVEYRADRTHIIAGTFSLGFAERLTFDTTSSRTPDGAVPNAQPSIATTSKAIQTDAAYRNSLTGIAVRVNQVIAGDLNLRADAWVSMQVHPVYQYEIDNDVRRTPDESAEEGTESSSLKSVTIPVAWLEPMVGAHVQLASSNARSVVGALGYVAAAHDLIRGASLTFADSSKWPSSHDNRRRGTATRYSAVGLYARISRPNGWWSTEASLTPGLKPSDSFAIFTRFGVRIPRAQLEGTLHHYGGSFENPHARAPSSSREVSGLRARGESGATLQVRSSWHRGSRFTVNLRGTHEHVDRALALDANALLALQFNASHSLQLRVGVADRNVRVATPNSCFAGSQSIAGTTRPCSGEQFRTSMQWSLSTSRRIALSLRVQHTAFDDLTYSDRRQQSALVSGAIRWHSKHACGSFCITMLQARSSMWVDDIAARRLRGAPVLVRARTTLELSVRSRSSGRLTARYALELNQRKSPEHIVLLGFELQSLRD